MKGKSLIATLAAMVMLATAAMALESLNLVDSPTAAVPLHGNYNLSCRLMASGSVLAKTEIGIKDRFAVGVSWGMLGLLGREEVKTYENTGLSFRLKLVEELTLPALSLGFDNQGSGDWDEGFARYERKSKGFYLAGTRTWYGLFGSDLATTFGMNYSLETEDDNGVDFFLGLEQSFTNGFGLIVDYTGALNDNADDEALPAFGEGRGWLDLALRWNIEDHVQFKFFFRDLLANYEGTGPVDRQLTIVYSNTF